MTSYVYNPSQKVTEILSKFLEFDPTQLELGIWSGDLSLSNVNLRDDAVYPLLNIAANKPHTDPFTKAPLHMKLVSGTVGHMRIRIPWKRLVWGQGDVQMEISDVSIVLAYENREDVKVDKSTATQSKETNDKSFGAPAKPKVSKSYRDAKQRRLNEAERRLLKGMPMSLYLNNIYRKNLIEREATKADELKAKEMNKAGNQVGRIESFLNNATKDFAWRFYAGLRGSIKKVRVVVVQDGVEVGCIIQSIEVSAGKDGVKMEVSIDENSTSEQTPDFPSDMKPPENFVYESGYDDGEHVDKTIKLEGLGLFVRKAVSMATVPKTLQFSSSVGADDYILQPGDLGLSYSFFYPFPPERRKKRSAETQSLGTSTTVASSDSTASAKRRRGKRERVPEQLIRTNSLDNLQRELPKREVRRNLSSGSLSPSRQASLRRAVSAAGSATPSGRRHRLIQSRRGLPSEEPNDLGVQSLHIHNRETSKYVQSNRFSSARSIKSGVSLGTTGRDVRSVLESPPVIAERPIQPVPKIDCRVNFEDVRVIFSNRHFELMSYFASTVQRVQNGRPKTTIRSVRDLYTTAAMPKDLRVEYEEAEKEQKTSAQSKLSSFLSLSQLRSLRSSGEEKIKETGAMKVEVSATPVLSPRSVVVRQWWKYVSNAVLWEIREKKHRKRNFLEMYVSFDWERQKYRRQEYINLYISTKLDKGWQSEVWPFEEDREEKLLQIEDELPLEQILLYRSIARSLHVKGISKMPSTILETYTTTPNFRAKSGEERKQKKVLERHGQDSSGSNLIDLLRNKYERTQKTRLENLVTWKTTAEESFATGGGMSDGARHSSGVYYPGSFTDDNSAGGNRSFGNEFKAGNFYSSGENRRDSRAGPRTITTRGKDSVHPRQTVAASGQSRNDVDSRMRLAVSLQVKCIDLMVVEENLIFEPLDDLGKIENGFGKAAQLDTGDFLDDESSSDQVSDLSVLTDDQIFFDEGSTGTIVEEGEEDGMQARLSSTDFLTFGRPDNVVLRMTVSQLGCSLRGISGAASQVRMHIGDIDLVDGNELALFSIGSEVSAPVPEVNLSSTTPLRSRHRNILDDSFRSSDAYIPDTNLLARARAVDRAVSLVVNLDQGFSAASCDVAKVDVNTHLGPVERLLLFQSQSKVAYPRKLVPVTSRDAARKLMLKRIANSSTFGANISIALRLYGFQVNVPFAMPSEEASSSSTSSSSRFSASSHQQVQEEKDSRLTFVVDTLELYTGRVVEEICAQEDQGHAGNSVASGFKNKISTLTNLEMINIVGLTGLHDSFNVNHFVASVSGMDCYLMTGEEASYNLCEMPIDTEILLTANGMPLLETESPKHKVVIEISPLHLLLSERRLALLSKAVSTIGDTNLNTAGVSIARDPDPPRIEILSNRILHSVDASCAQIKFDLVRDGIQREELSVEAKVLVMEEALSDFLSVGACFDFDLPNEEALSSAMQVCIGRLVGLGFSDDEAWGCVNSARLNFLDDVAQMRQAHDNALVHISASLRKESSSKSNAAEENSPVHDGMGRAESANMVGESEKLITVGDDQCSSSSHDITESDDDSAESAGIVEMTITDAVEKTVTMFSPLLEEYQHDEGDSSPVLSIELPLGLRLSLVKLFYDQHLTFVIASIVMANKAGIEILTLVPYSNEEHNADEVDEQAEDGNFYCVNFSRFDFDKSYNFGSGGLPISVLGSDEGASDDLFFRDRARLDDVELGELEFLFSSTLLEDVSSETLKLGKSNKSTPYSNGIEPNHSSRQQDRKLDSSTVVVASCVSVLFASDELVPFSRITIEDLTFKNQQALRTLHLHRIPTWTVLAQSFVLQNLSPEGQFYPDVLGPLIQKSGGDIPFQVRYHASSSTQEAHNQLEIEFTAFRFYLLRNFVYELLHFFGHERYGLGRMKTKILGESDEVDRSGKGPLSLIVKLNDSSIICPRSSACSDMVSFEVSEARVELSHVDETFAMPTEESTFDANPRNRSPFADPGDSFASFDIQPPSADRGNQENAPAKSIRRTCVTLTGVRVFTAIAESKEEREHVEDPLFRYVHEVNESVDAGKLIYRRKDTIDDDMFLEVEFCEQRWEEISSVPLHVAVIADYAPHLRLLISSCDSTKPFALDAQMSQLCLLISIWDSNMQEMPSMFPFTAEEIETFATPPSIPASFPKYGTDAFIRFLEDHSSVRTEICCLFKSVSIRCSYDSPGRYAVDPYCFRYFKNPGCDKKDREGVVLTLGDAAIHIMNDHLNVKRIAVGASSIELNDERQTNVFRTVIKSSSKDYSKDSRAASSAWADLRWGLRDDIKLLSDKKDLQGAMFTVFMTPGWSLINVGMQDINGIMHDLSWLWVLLEYFKSYYTNAAFGNFAFHSLKWAHGLKKNIRKGTGEETSVDDVDNAGRNIDVRLWLRRPVLCLPSDYSDPQAPSLRLHSRSGLWYRYKSLNDFSSQEVASTDLNLFFLNEFQTPGMYRQKDVRGTMSSQPIVEGLSFGLRYDYNHAGSHTDCSVLIPYAGDEVPSLAIAGGELEVPPLILNPPTVCTPYKPIERNLGPRVCELTAIIEVIPIVTSTLVNFFTGPSRVNEEFVTEEEDPGPQTFSITAALNDCRAFLIDPVLGVQLPVAVLSIASLSVTATQFATKPNPETSDEAELKDPPPNDLHVVANCGPIWADYFKLGLTRSWEPLLEPFQCLILYERSQERGQGVSIDADTPFHVNLTGAVLQVLGDTVDSFSTLIQETFSPKTKQNRVSKRVSMSMAPTAKAFAGAMAHDEITFHDGKKLSVVHERPRPLKRDDRVAFSLCNMTGQRIRIHQQSDITSEKWSDKPAILTYLNQADSVGLTFAATISVIKNLTIQEVPYPGFENSQSNNHNEGSLNQAIDIQVPGFRWLQGVRVDSFGRKFQTLLPRSEKIQLKINRDWRLRNALMLLTEVGFSSGGRVISIRSCFEIRNTTNHPIKLVFHPDPRYQPVEKTERDSSSENVVTLENETFVGGEDVQTIQPGESVPIPTLLLEKSLQLTGSHLGCFWLCPEALDTNISYWDFVTRNDENPTPKEIHSSFCSRPVQLARIVHESSILFKNGSGLDITGDDAKTGIQVSCSTHLSSGEVRAPFCYALEVGRSPLVKHEQNLSPDDSLHNGDLGLQVAAAAIRDTSKELIHSPVAYTLSIHAPIIVVNLLPEGGRFELMHAINRTVLWFADLEPGQQIAVHSVGLDSPLLLLLNLGFCRTPVGEGALIHHGVDSPLGGEKEQGVRFKAIGKAAIQGTKQIGKTLTAMSDSPDKRGRGKLAEVNAAQFSEREKRKRKSKRQSVVKATDQSLGLDTSIGGMATAEQGKVHAVESVVYSANDVATSTTVVDSVGQRLTLSIENVRGGGGQRRVALYCPFWIVNNTEHALRYKQDKSKSFVSGTVISPEKDGSRPVDGSNRNYQNLHEIQSARRNMSQERIPMNTKTIFSGTHGSLATSPGRCELPPAELAELIEKDIPLQKLADLAFMFNFNDELSIGNAMLSVQLYDGTGQSSYKSDWSRGVSLDSVGYYQIVGMPTKDGRSLELSVEVNVAPGFLSPYTKIVRFLPRYIVFNRLERPIRLWQDSSVFRPVNEDRGAAATETLQSSKLSRKWRYNFEESNHHGKINQYESLFGKPVIIDDSKCNKAAVIRGAETITEGTTAHKSAQYIASVGPHELAPFSLPDSRAERQFRVDLGGMWNVTSSFASELPGEHILAISRSSDLSLLKHVSTRAAPKYKIVLPPPDDSAIGEWDGELGVFFETDWGGDRTIIVKGTKRGKYAYNHTDIHVGDELLRVDGVSVVRMSFAETMKLIKERLAYVASVRKQQKDAEKQPKRGLRRLSISGPTRRFSAPFFKQSSYEEGSNAKPAHLTLTFRTFEERLRKLRLKAGTGDGNLNLNLAQRRASGVVHQANIEGVSVEMKSWHNTMFVVIREQDKDNPLFLIRNRSVNHIVFYRQRGCNGHPWNHLMPGESKPYSWEEPMKAKKLSVRVAAKAQDIFRLEGMMGSQEAFSDEGSVAESEGVEGDGDKHGMRAARLAQALAHQFVDNEERGGYGPSISVRLEEIGYRSLLPIHVKDGSRSRRKFLNCEVDTDGGTRLLVVSDDSGSVDERVMLKRNLDTLKKQIAYEQDRISELHSQKFLFSQIAPDFAADGTPNENNGRAVTVESNAARLVDDFPEESTINCRHQVVVEVIEAIGLNVSDFVGSCNPYCEVFLKGRSKSRKYFFQKRKNKRQTYYIQKSLNPRWTDQVFVYDVPEEAVSVTRGYTIQVKLRNFRLVGQHPILGQASVHFGSLRNQQELVGWYPLSGSRSGQRDGEAMQLSDSSRGSIKLRVQWIYTVPALLDYFLLISQRRLNQLMKSREGMTTQLAHAVESERNRREAMDQLSSGRIQNLVKLQRKRTNGRKIAIRNEVEMEKVVGKLNQGLNTGLSQLKDTLKTSRDKYLYALYYQTVESRRNRLEKKDSTNQQVTVHAKVSKKGGTSTLRKSKKSLENYIVEKASASKRISHTSIASPSPEKFQSNRRALNNFFKIQKNRSLRRLSVDDNAIDGEKDVETVDKWDSSIPNGKAMYEGLYSQDRGMSDVMSSAANDSIEAGKTQWMLQQLLLQGFLFHECGVFFHRAHLPRRFRKILFAQTAGDASSGRRFRPKHIIGSGTTIRHFRSWQFVYAVYWDPELQIERNQDEHILATIEKPAKPAREIPAVSETRFVIMEKLAVPVDAPLVTAERARARADTMFMSRLKFERACKRILGSVLNPGGWLTIRPITVLNLPDTFTGMFVKLRYGSEVLISETVDARVTPRWSTGDIFDTHHEATGGFKFNNNDLHVRVEPQQTSGSIMISVVAEKMNAKTELGVLQLPLGDAIAACIDSGEELSESSIRGEAAGQAMYVRWFPLMEPRMSEQVEGDMGLSSRPLESEKLRDNMFEQYFTPCIQLALIWWPDGNDSKNDGDHRTSAIFDASQRQTGRNQMHRSTTPMIENYFNADISRISAALIDSQRAIEILSFAAIDIDVRYSVSKTKTRVGLVVGWIQIDHQDSRAREPVVLAPTPMEDLQPTLQFLALRDNLKTKSNIISYEYIGVYLQEMDLVVEEFWLFELWEFFMVVLRRSQVKRSTTEGRELADALSKENCFIQEEAEDSYGPSLLTILQDTEHSAASSSKKKFYIEQLILGLVKINLSYMKGKKHSWEMAEFSDQEALMKTLDLAATKTKNKANSNSKSEQSDAFQRWSQHTFDEDLFAGGDGSNHLPAIIAAVFPSVSDASIRLQGKAIEHVFESPSEIFSSIKNFYVNETLKQVYKIIGSIDFVGNPTSIISSFVSGVRDLVVVPATAIMRSPTDVNQVGIEVAKGTISFFSHSTSGIFGFLAKMSASAGQTVAILSLDSEYRQWHRDTVVAEATDLNRVWKRRGMQNASKIVLRPVRDVLLGVAMGASGLVVSPYKGFKKGGPLGLVRGIATGTAGIVAKPIVGVLDAFTHVSATMHDAARSANILERRYQPSLKLRLPYTFGPMKILAPFNAVTARAMYLLKEFPPKTKRNKLNNGRSAEYHIHSEVLKMEQGVDTFAIVSTLRVVLIKLKRENTGLSPSFGWEVSLSEPALVTSLISDHGHNGVALTITKSREEKELSVSEKTRQNGKPSNGGPISNSIHSSVLSFDSRDSFSESDIDGVNREAFSSSVDLEDRDDPNYKYGLTRKQGEVLEWFTVLAEFQHRKQLTRLHNAVCCVVRDFDAVVIDRASGVDPISRKDFTFGLYLFGAVPSASLIPSRCNVDTIAALENMPWMQDSTFNVVRNLPEHRQIEEVAKLRRGWMFSKELEASTKQGGPRWLIEARARAMFVPTNPPALLEYLDTYDPIVEKLHWEWKQGNISSEQASQLLEAHNESLSIPSAFDDDSDNGILQSGRNDVDSGDAEPQSELSSALSGLHPVASVNSDIAERRNSSESFYSAQLEHSAVDLENINQGSVGDQIPNHNPQRNDLESRPKFSEMPKVDRMEALLEQLILLNVHQATKEAAGNAASAQSVPHPESRMLNEVLALRSEIQEKTKKDTDLQKEISLLRQQLAQADSRTETENGKTRKLRDLFGIGLKKAETMKSNTGRGEKLEHIEVNHSRASQSKTIQFSKEPPHTHDFVPHRGFARQRASSFDGSNDSPERDYASGVSLDSSFQSGNEGVGREREKKKLGRGAGDISTQSFDGDGFDGFFLPDQMVDSVDRRKQLKEGSKVKKLKTMLHFGRKKSD